MPVPFGFGVSDLVEGINIIRTGITALNDTRGAKASYRDFSETLSDLLHTLVALENLELPPHSEQSKNAINRHISRIRNIISNFIATTTKFQRSLLGPGTGWWMNSLRKIEWQICKKEDLDSFNERLRRQELHLITCLTQVSL